MELLLYNGKIINQGQLFIGSVLIRDGIIAEIYPDNVNLPIKVERLDVSGKYILPGAIDSHVHFREPGLTHKGDIASESRAALVGGVTSFLDMPNTIPPTVSEEYLKIKLSIAAKKSAINYGFYIALTKDNLKNISRLPLHLYPGIKVFYAPSTGNLICNDTAVLTEIFRTIDKPFVIHSEDYDLLNQALLRCKELTDIPPDIHLHCRPHRVCTEATKRLLSLAQQTQARVHFLHISTAEEVELLRSNKSDNITAEVCPHYLWFDSSDYSRMGNFMKVNPSIKYPRDRQVLIDGVKTGVFDTIGTDHAPHLLEEKKREYWQSPSGAPSLQHFYPVVFTIFAKHNINFARIPLLTAHNPAKIFNIKNRGYIRKGYKADIAVVEEGAFVESRILHKCGWSVFQDEPLSYRVFATFVNGQLSYLNGKLFPVRGEQLIF